VLQATDKKRTFYSQGNIKKNVLLNIVSFYDDSLASKYRAGETCVEHALFIVFSILLCLTCILYLTGRGDYKHHPGGICWPSTFMCLLVSYAFEIQRPSFTEACMWDEKTEPDS